MGLHRPISGACGAMPLLPSSALPASGFVGIISARDIKAPL